LVAREQLHKERGRGPRNAGDGRRQRSSASAQPAENPPTSGSPSPGSRAPRKHFAGNPARLQRIRRVADAWLEDPAQVAAARGVGAGPFRAPRPILGWRSGRRAEPPSGRPPPPVRLTFLWAFLDKAFGCCPLSAVASLTGRTWTSRSGELSPASC
jgi:hypothetical protein